MGRHSRSRTRGRFVGVAGETHDKGSGSVERSVAGEVGRCGASWGGKRGAHTSGASEVARTLVREMNRNARMRVGGCELVLV
jgi:hypothetical protein